MVVKITGLRIMMFLHVLEIEFFLVMIRLIIMMMNLCDDCYRFIHEYIILLHLWLLHFNTFITN